MLKQGANLEQAIYNTIHYFDLFGMPVTATQIWRSLVVDRTGTGGRWHGQHTSSLRDVQEVLAQSRLLSNLMVRVWGYYCLRSSAGGDVEGYVRARLLRHAEAQRKWRITRRVVRWLAPLPFVRMIGGSGSLAQFNTRADSDLDLFIVVRAGRIWTARLGLLLVSQLTGRRRKYWVRRAPDKVCLNHYVTDEAMGMASAVQSVYGAQLYYQLIPLTGFSVFAKWRQENEAWWRAWLMYPSGPLLSSRLYVQILPVVRVIKRSMEAFLLELPGDFLEKWAEAVQRRAIAEHTRPGQVGRVVVSDTELAFHPDTKVPALLARYEQEAGQRALL